MSAQSSESPRRGLDLWLSALLLPPLLAAAYLAVARVQREGAPERRRVELGYDYGGFQELCRLAGKDPRGELGELRKAGATALGLHEDTPMSLAASGRAAVVTAGEAAKLRASGRGDVPALVDGETAFLSGDRDLLERIQIHAALRLGLARVRAVRGRVHAVVIRAAGKESFERLPLGIPNEDVAAARRHGFREVLRLANFDPPGGGAYRAALRALPAPADGSAPALVLFGGDEALGWDRNLSAAAAALAESRRPIAMLETAEQKGGRTLFQRAPILPQLVRASGMTLREIESAPPERAVQRWVRAATERSSQVLYLQPFLTLRSDLWARNLGYVRNVSRALGRAGFETGSVAPRPLSPQPPVAVWLCGLGALVSVLVLASALTGGRRWIVAAAGLLFLAGMAAVYATSSTQRVREALALAAAVALPAAALFRVAPPEGTGLRAVGSALLAFALLAAHALGAGLLVAGLLGDAEWTAGIRSFSGVKLALLGPPAIVLVGMMLRGNALAPGRAAWESAADRRFVATAVGFAVVAVAAAALVVMRSGNQPAVRPPVFEELLRERLEWLFSVRPRTKEFLIGHPLLVLSLLAPLLVAGADRAKIGTLASWFPPFAALAAAGGAVGLASLANSFAHLHTPLAVTLVRSAHGLWIGALLGVLLAVVLARCRRS